MNRIRLYCVNPDCKILTFDAPGDGLAAGMRCLNCGQANLVRVLITTTIPEDLKESE